MDSAGKAAAHWSRRPRTNTVRAALQMLIEDASHEDFRDHVDHFLYSAARLRSGHVRKHSRNIVRGQRAATLGQRLELLENCGGPRHSVFLTGDADFAVAMSDGDAQCFSDSPQVLVAGTKQRQHQARLDHR